MTLRQHAMSAHQILTACQHNTRICCLVHTLYTSAIYLFLPRLFSSVPYLLD